MIQTVRSSSLRYRETCGRLGKKKKTTIASTSEGKPSMRKRICPEGGKCKDGSSEDARPTNPPLVDGRMSNARDAESDQSTERTSDDTSTDEKGDTLGDFAFKVPDREVQSHRLTKH